jgi:hypothetical protein
MNRKKIAISSIIATGLSCGFIVGVFGLSGYFGGGDKIPEDTFARGLVAYYSFDEGSGQTAYNAASTGSVNDASDGTDDYVDCGSDPSLNITDAITISAWVKFDNDVRSDFVGKGGYSGDTREYILYKYTDNKIYFTWSDDGAGSDDISSAAIDDNWHHIASTFLSGEVYLYIDGVSTHKTSLRTSINTETSILEIGYSCWGGNYTNGSIDEVRIYNRALSAEEIRYHYNRGGPVAHWRMDEGEGSTIYDATDNNNDGALNLAPSGNTATSSAWVRGKHGSALNFDGVDDYVDCGNDSSLDITNAITISAWASNFSATTTRDEGILNFNYSSGYLMTIYQDDIFSQYGSKNIHTRGKAPADTDLHHYVFTASGVGDGIVFKHYLDGLQIDTVTRDSVSPAYGTASLFIGAQNTVPAYFFNGSIDDVKIYNYARSADEIRLDYNAGFAAHFGGGRASACSDDPGACMDLGLVGYWNFDEGAGETAYDQSLISDNSSVNDATLGDGTCAAGAGKCPKHTTGIEPLSGGKEGGGALDFDGSNDYVDCGSDPSLDITDAITIEAWVNKQGDSSADGSYGGIYWKYRDIFEASRTGEDLIVADNGRVSFSVYSYNVANTVNTLTDEIQNGQWYHLVVKVDTSANYVYLYVNGVEKDKEAYTLGTRSYGTTGASAYVGAWANGPYRFFNGAIDEVRIYNRALSAEEIRYHYNRGGPVAHWRMDEGSGSTIHDEIINPSTDSGRSDGHLHLAPSGNTATSSAWVAGRHGSALNFDGVDDYVDCGSDSSLDITNAITISAWVKAENVSAGARQIVTKYDAGVAGAWMFKIVSQKIAWFIESTSEILGITTIEVDKWYHLTATFDGTTSKVYVNGNLENTGDIGGIPSKPTLNVWIGAQGITGSPGNPFDGAIDDVKIYNYARSAEEIRLDYNAGFAAHFGPSAGSGQAAQCPTDPGACMDLGLVGYWNFDEGSGETTYNGADTGSVNDGTLKPGSGDVPKWTTGVRPLQGGASGGGALDFDGTDDYVDCGNDPSLNITDAITVMAWVKRECLGSYKGIVSKGKADEGYALSIGYVSGNDIMFTTLGVKDYKFSTSITDSNWYHMVVVYDSSYDTTLYLNGDYKEKIEHDVESITSNEHCYIGGKLDNIYFDGSIDEVRIYNRALSAEEIRYHYNRGGPVAHWRMDEGEGSVVYNENNQLSLITDNLNGALHLGSSGNTATSSAWVAGRHGSALNFDGVDDYVDCGNDSALDITDAITISAWVKPNSAGEGDYGRIVGKRDSQYYFLMMQNGTKVTLNIGDTAYATTPTDSVPFGEWSYLAATFDKDFASNQIKVYINGKEISVGTRTTPIPNSLGYSVLIGNNNLFHRTFDGAIDDVKIYNYARTAEQILMDYNAGLGTYFK